MQPLSKTQKLNLRASFFYLVIFVFLSRQIIAQQEFQQGSLYSSFDTKSILLGKSVIANEYEPQSYKLNPASIAFTDQIIITSNYTGVNKFNDLYNAGVQIPTSIGKFGISYSKFAGDYLRNAVANYSVTNTDDHTITISYGNKIFENLHFGLNCNLYEIHSNDFLNNNYSASQTYFDFGLIYSGLNFLNADDIKDQMNIGLSVEGLGEKLSYLNYPQALAQYLRIGFMYRVHLSNTDKDEYLRLTFNSLYRNYLNSEPYYALKKDSWAFGIEAFIYKHLLIFLGGNIEPSETQYAEQRDISFSYGLGGNINAGIVSLKLSAGVIPSLYSKDTFTVGLDIVY